jgi:hypothetical protein
MNIRTWFFRTCIICIIISTFVGASLSQSAPTIVNVMIDYDTPAHPTEDQLNESRPLFNAIVKAINSRELNATVFLTTDVTRTKERMLIAMAGRNPKIEFALGGNNSGERLSTMSLSKQEILLQNIKKYVDLTHFCDVNSIDSRGFKPQLFDQNNDTYKVLDEMGMWYDAGYQAGILYLPGHKADVWPYPAEGHKFYAVPVSTENVSGEKVPLIDKLMKGDKGLSARQWKDLLESKYDQAASKNEPLVAIFSISVSGSGEYLGALSSFLDYALSKNARFVTTSQLVNITKTAGENNLSELKSSASLANATKAGCSICDSLKTAVNNSGINDTTVNGTRVITLSPSSSS